MPHIAVNAQLLSTTPGYRRAGVSVYIASILQAMWRLPEAAAQTWTLYLAPGGAAGLNAPPGARVRTSLLPTERPGVRVLWEQAVAPLLYAAARPDVVFCPLSVIPLLGGRPRVVTIHDLAFYRFDFHRRHKRAYLRAMTRLTARKAAHVITVSEFTRREVIDLLGVDPARVTAVPNGCDARFGPLDKTQQAAARARLGLPERYLLTVGTLEPRKDLPTLVRAYAAVRHRLDMPLVVVGGRGWRDGLFFRLIADLGLQDDVKFLGYVPDRDLSALYAAATVCIYPSVYEGFGLPLVEAMASGTPVIASDAEALREVGGASVRKFAAGNVAALAAALVDVAGDGADAAVLRGRLRERGLARAAEFSWDAAARATLRLLLAQVRG